jgi:hypothetical protein
LNYGDDLEGEVYVLRDAIGHELKDAIGWNESNGSVTIKPT